MILVTAALLVIGSTLNAQPRNGSGYDNGMELNQGQGYNNNGNGFGSGARFERMQIILKLTDEQTTKISDLRFEHEQMALEANSEIQKHRLIVRKMMTDNNIDQEKLLKITNENSEFQGKIKLSRTTMWLEVYNMLDDTQKEQWTNTFGQNGRGGQNSKGFHKQGRGGSGNRDCGNNNCCGRSHHRRMR